MPNRIRSSVPGIVFPAFPSTKALALAALELQLEQSQWWSADDILDLQMAQLRELLDFARRNNAFYQRRMADAGLGGEWIRELTPETFRRLPPLPRAEFQRHQTEIVSRNLPEAHGRTSETRTSGSTGTPVVAKGTAVTRSLWRAFTLRNHLWHRRDFRQPFAAIRTFSPGFAPPPSGRSADGWGSVVDDLYDSGAGLALESSAPVEVQYDWLLSHEPAYLLTYPSNLQALARHATGQARRPPALRECLAVGESVSDGLRRVVREVFGCGISDIYSCQEGGYIALQCPDHAHYHVVSEGVYVEIVDDEGQPLGPGRQGHVLVTNLHNFATPLIRYRLGDMAEFGEPCACGRGLPVIRRVMGRVRNMLVLPDGTTHWPYFGFKEFMAVADVRQFQVIQRSLELVEFRLVVDRRLSSSQEARIAEILQRNLRHPFRIAFDYVDEIPRSRSGKYEDFISHVDTRSG